VSQHFDIFPTSGKMIFLENSSCRVVAAVGAVQDRDKKTKLLDEQR
jgi:hypothetical protein